VPIGTSVRLGPFGTIGAEKVY
jgi:hypothetical protein